MVEADKFITNDNITCESESYEKDNFVREDKKG